MLMQNLTMSCEPNSDENCLEIVDDNEKNILHYNTIESDVVVCNTESKINNSLKHNEVREMESEEKPITLKRRYCISLISFNIFSIYFFCFHQTHFSFFELDFPKLFIKNEYRQNKSTNFLFKEV